MLLRVYSVDSVSISLQLRSSYPHPYRVDLCKVGFQGGKLRVDVGIGTLDQTKYLSDAPQELKVAAACLCAGLMPPSIFADLLEDHRPDLAEAAAFLREWEQVHKEQQK